jgi:hypothetical protein
MPGFKVVNDQVSHYCCAAEVYSPLGGVDRGSIYKRGGRFSPEFLWNTNWQDQVQLQPFLSSC